MVADYEIVNSASEIVKEAVSRRAKERMFADRRLPDSYRASPHTAWAGEGTDTDYAALEMSYQWIVDVFRNAIPPDPSGFTNLASGMQGAMTELCGGKEFRIHEVAINSQGEPELVAARSNSEIGFNELRNNIETAISTWSGTAALAFREGFVNKIPGVLGNQAAIALSLHSAAEGSRRVYEAAREKLGAIAKATLDVLRYQDDTVAPDLSIPLSVASGGFAVAAAVPGIGTAAVVTLTTISAGVGVGKDIYQDAHDDAEEKRKERDSKKTPMEREIAEFRIGGGTVEAILNRMHEAIKTVTRQVTEAEDTIINMLEKNIALMQKSPGDFASPRPYLVNDIKNGVDLNQLRNGFFTTVADPHSSQNP